MRRFLIFTLVSAAQLFFCGTTRAQDQPTQAAILQKLTDIENRLNDMDKRYEVRFTKIEERFNTIDERFKTIDERFNRIEDKIAAVNQRIDDKFNLIVYLLGIIAAFLALPYAPKLIERFKVKGESQRLQEQIDQLKAQIEQLTGRP